MKELRGNAAEVVAAPIDRCFALLEAVDAYPAWHPEVVQVVEVLDRDARGLPSRVRTKLHVSQGPLVKDFDLLMAVVTDRPRTVALTRVADQPSEQKFDVRWRLQAGEGTRIELGLNANLNVPRFLPLGGIGDSMARGFVAAAARALVTPLGA